MKKQLLRRGISIFLTAAVLLSSTSAYNLLVYADQTQVGASSSAIDASSGVDEYSAADIVVSGGNITFDENSDSFRIEDQSVSLTGDGTQQSPFLIGTAEQFLAANAIINDISGTYQNKYFALTADIDLSGLTVNDFATVANYAYFIGCEQSDANCWFKLDGQNHTISGGSFSITGHHTLSIFGKVNSLSSIENIYFENITLRASSAEIYGVGIITYRNEGLIQNCEVNGCSVIDVSTRNVSGSAYSIYDRGVAGAVVTNTGTIDNVGVNNLHVSTSNTTASNIAGLVAVNNGLVDTCSVSGLVLTANAGNNYVGGLVGTNAYGATVTASNIDLPGTQNYIVNITNGNYVGGLVGYNIGTLYNSSVVGSVSTTTAPTVSNCNIKVYSQNTVSTYYGGAAGYNEGSISYVTVSDVGVFAVVSASVSPITFGGITAVSQGANSVHHSVAVGSFAHSAFSGLLDLYTGGIIGYADANTATYEINVSQAAVNDCYALFKIVNTTRRFFGAVVGKGGSELVYHNCYWSSDISGSITAYVGEDSLHNVTDFDQVDGNFVLETRAIAARRFNTGIVARGSLGGHWNALSGTVPATVSSPAQDVEYRGTQDGSVLTLGYSSLIDFSISGQLPKAGSVDMATMHISIPLFVAVLDTQPVGDPGDATDPLCISTSAQAAFIYKMPFGHYKLTNDVSVTSDPGTVFIGTLDGNGHTVSIRGQLFEAVVGNIVNLPTVYGGSTSAEAYYTDPSELSADAGVIKGLTIKFIPDDNAIEQTRLPLVNGGERGDAYVIAIDSSVFGDAYDAGFVDVKLDGEDYFAADITEERSGVFLNNAYGKCYVYGCSSNVDTYFGNSAAASAVNASAFIGFLFGPGIYDNNSIDLELFTRGTSAVNYGGFIGNAKNEVSVSGGGSYHYRAYIINNIINGVTHNISGASDVRGATASGANLFLGTECGNNVLRENFWSYPALDNPYIDANTGNETTWYVYERAVPETYTDSYYNNNYVRLVKGEANNDYTGTNGYTYRTLSCIAGSSVNYTIVLPQRVAAYANTQLSDFIITNISANQEFTASAVLTSGSLVVTIDGDSAFVNDVDIFEIYNTVSGLYSYVTVRARNAVLEIGSDGFVHITSSSELKKISDLMHENKSIDGTVNGTPLASSLAYKLDANIDMSAYDGSSADLTFHPLGSTANPFTGIFTADTDNDGAPLYAITGLYASSKYYNGSNLAYIRQGVGLFGAVNFLGAAQTIGGVTYPLGISNIKLIDPVIEAIDGAGALVGIAIGGKTNSTGVTPGTQAGGTLKITNVIIDGAVVRSGINYDANGDIHYNTTNVGGRSSGIAVGAVVGMGADINGLIITDSSVDSYYVSSAPNYFTGNAYFNNASGGVLAGAAIPGGMGGVIGSVGLLSNAQDSLSFNYNFSNVHLTDVSLSGVNVVDGTETAPSVNAGGIIGNADRYFSDANAVVSGQGFKINIGSSSYTAGNDGYGYDVTVDDSYINGGGNVGGFVGNCFAVLLVNKSAVRGSQAPVAGSPESAYSTVIKTNAASTADLVYGVGGIAGHAGINSVSTNDNDGDDSNGYSYARYAYTSVMDSLVEGCWIRNENEQQYTSNSTTSSATDTLRSSVAGGIVGAGNGYGGSNSPLASVAAATTLATDASDFAGVHGYLVESSTVNRCHIEAVIAGGLAGTCSNDDAVANSARMSMRFYNSKVSGCFITTTRKYTSGGELDETSVTIPGLEHFSVGTAGTNRNPNGGGVGGILGGNKLSVGQQTYLGAGSILIDSCTVDKYTTVYSAIPVALTINSTAYSVYSSAGGLAGTLSASASNGRYVAINNCYCAATVESVAENVISEAFGNTGAYAVVRSSVGGLVGALRGTATGAASNHSLVKTTLHDSVFSGIVRGKNVVGGLVGSFIHAAVLGNYAASGINVMYNLVMSGKLDVNVTAADTIYKAGYITGHIMLNSGSSATSSAYAFVRVTGSNEIMVSSNWIHDIYFSSFDNPEIPAYVTANLKSATNTAEVKYFAAFTDRTYYDVNKLASSTLNDSTGSRNDVVQYSDVASCSAAMTVGSAPVDPRGIFSPTGNWTSTLSGVISVTGSSTQAPTITPHRIASTASEITIDYVKSYASLGAGSTSYTAVLKAGFRATSSYASALDIYTDTVSGKSYHIIRSADDLMLIGKDVTPSVNDYTAAMMDKNYALADDIDCSDAEFRAANSTGLISGATIQVPFTGSIQSLPAGTYYVNNTSNTETVSENNIYTISDLVLGKTAENYVGLVAVASGAEFSNFKMENVSVADNVTGCNYIGSVAAVVYAVSGGAEAPLTASNIDIITPSLSGADYTGGIFGGVFASVPGATSASDADNALTSTITGCSVSGTGSQNGVISGAKAAAGILVHTSQFVMDISDVSVSKLTITQTDVTADETYDNGAAGLVVAYSGQMDPSTGNRITVEDCDITGLVASGAILRSYSSNDAYAFTSVPYAASTTSSVKFVPVLSTQAAGISGHKVFSLSGIDIIGTDVTGTCTVGSGASNPIRHYPQSAGILARADRITLYDTAHTNYFDPQHYISDCTLDASTVVKGYSVGGILGSIEGTSVDQSAGDQNYHDGIIIENCTVSATLIATAVLGRTNISFASASVENCTMGCGGIIGVYSRKARIEGSSVKNCIVDGKLVGDFAVGGLIGNLATYNRTAYRTADVTRRFLSYSVVSASFYASETDLANGDDVFRGAQGSAASAEDANGTGIFIGFTLGASYHASATNNQFQPFIISVADALASAGKELFYGLYFSSLQYPYATARPFGRMITTRTGTADPSFDNLTSSVNVNLATQKNNPNGYYHTKYVFDLNTVKDFSTYESYKSGEDASYAISWQDSGLLYAGRLTASDTGLKSVYRINDSDVSSPDGRLLPDYGSLIGSGISYDVNSDVDFVNSTDGVAVSGSGTSTFTATLGSQTTSFVLDSVSVLSADVTAVYDPNSHTVTLSIPASLYIENNINTYLVFTYKNGLKLGCPMQIKISHNEKWYLTDTTTNRKTYLVFNADNLNILANDNVTNDTINQCFDVFWNLTSEDAAVITSVDAMLDTTVGTYYNGVNITMSDGTTQSLLSVIGSFMHRNPDYDRDDPTSQQYQSFIDTFVNSGLYSSVSDVPLRELVGTPGLADYTEGQTTAVLYGETSPFAGKYYVLDAPSTLTYHDDEHLDLGDTYCIYGLHLVHHNQSGDDATAVGLFNAVGSGAVIDGINFIKPDIRAVGTKTSAVSTGVLAGSVSGAVITDASVKDGQIAVYHGQNGSAASVYVGGLVGVAQNTSFTGVDVSGLTIVNSLGTTATSAVEAASGGVGGKMVSSNVSNFTSDSLTVLTGRERSTQNREWSYAGSVAGLAGGTSGSAMTVNNAVVTNCVIGDCSGTVSVSGSAFTVSYAQGSGQKLDIAGGIVGKAENDITLLGCVFGTDENECSVTAFDMAGGILGTVVDSASGAAVQIGAQSGTETSVNADVKVSGQSMPLYRSSRIFANAAGGVVGSVRRLGSLSIENIEYNGYVGAYDPISSVNIKAGGIIGYIDGTSASSGYLDAITVSGCVAMGEVVGMRTGNTVNQYLGAAGGLIGVINYDGAKADSAVKLVEDAVVSSTIKLYTGGSSYIDASDESSDSLSAPYTAYIGKILGSLFGANDFATTPVVDYDDYFCNVVYSSYPQALRAYGPPAFYEHQSQLANSTYMDINIHETVEQQEGENVTVTSAAFQLGTGDASGANATAYSDDIYTSTAVVKEGSGVQRRHFRLFNPEVTVGSRTVELAAATGGAENRFGVVVPDSFTGQAPEISNVTYGNPPTMINSVSYGSLSIEADDQVVATLTANYNYGLQIAITLITVDIEGLGTSGEPFEIDDVTDLKVIRYLPASYYIQVANLDLAPHYSQSNEYAEFADGHGFDPIGDIETPFGGHYDGDGYVISNLYINRPTQDNVGFFGYVNVASAEIKNLHIEIASDLPVSDASENISVVSGVLGKRNVGALAGNVNLADLIHNCSAAGGWVVGTTSVGGLIGRAASVDTVSSCFTSTSVYSSIPGSVNNASLKAVGALIGTTSIGVTISNSFTAGFASVGSNINYGAAGGLVGSASGSLTLSGCFVGATVSNNNQAAKGLTVGSTGTNGAVVTATNVYVAALRMIPDSTNSSSSTPATVNPILGASGATCTNVKYDKQLVGALNTTESATYDATTPSSYTISIGTVTLSNGNQDNYTVGYQELISAPVITGAREADERRVVSQGSFDSDTSKYIFSGYFYPLTFKTSFSAEGSVLAGATPTLKSSVYDTTDTVGYPALDTELYGNGRNGTAPSKYTDLLFKDLSGDDAGKTVVYRNIFESAKAGPTLSDNQLTDYNGEIAYDYSAPYVDLVETKSISFAGTSGTVQFIRKIVYPLANRGSVYPIATARQLNAISDSGEAVTGTKFAFLSSKNSSGFIANSYMLVADIDMCGNVAGTAGFTPIECFNGVFDGGDFTVDNLKINGGSDNEIGMFRSLSGGTIRNLHLAVNSVTGGNNVGALAGAVVNQQTTAPSVTITNCSVTNASGGTGVSGGKNVGGLIGAVMSVSGSSNINGCYADVDVTGTDVVGGLLGYCSAPINNCYATGKITGSFTNSTSKVTVTSHDPSAGWAYASAAHGIGGLVGVMAAGSLADTNENSASGYATPVVSNSFASGEVFVNSVAYGSDLYGVGGLVGVIKSSSADVSTAFSSGNVNYCNAENATVVSVENRNVGIGGLVGYTAANVSGVYSSASVDAHFGAVNANGAVGAGGVVGVSVASSGVNNCYSSGNTTAVTSTDEVNAAQANYGVGAVVGYNSSGNGSGLWYDLNVATLGDDKPVGKGGYSSNCGSLTTAQLTGRTSYNINNAITGFNSIVGAYPYLEAFFNDNVSLTVRIYALLSIVALELNPLDLSAAAGEGISMSLNIPVSLTYSGNTSSAGTYYYGYSEENSRDNSAYGLVDTLSNTISIQRTTNESEPVYFNVHIARYVSTDPNADPADYSSIATRTIQRMCSKMLGTQNRPYLIASQEDLEHVGLTAAQSAALSGDAARYKQWATPINDSGIAVQGKLYFRLMGYIDLDNNYSHTIPYLVGQNYDGISYAGISLDGNGYSIRNLSCPLFAELDTMSKLENINFENVDFGGSESLVGTNNGTIEFANVYGSASGSSTAAIAQINGTNGSITGCIGAVDTTNAAGSNAGLVVTNNGEIELCASVGNFTSSSSVSGLGGLVSSNAGTIRQCFTYGDINLVGASNAAGFVGTNSGTIESCYTRCNIFATGSVAANSNTVGSFVGSNSSTGSITNCWSSGVFSRATSGANDTLTVFAGSNSGALSNCWYDKQMTGTGSNGNIVNNYENAARTADLVGTTTGKMPSTGNYPYVYAGYSSSTPNVNIYYPQLSEIVESEYIASEYVNASESEIDAAQIYSRKMNLLRGYSFISSATAMIELDNYSDNLRPNTITQLSYAGGNDNLWTSAAGNSHTVYAANLDGATVLGRHVAAQSAGGRDVYTTNHPVEPFYNDSASFITTASSKQLNLYFSVDGTSHPNFGGGWGTQADPFVINNPTRVIALSYFGSNAGNYYEVSDSGSGADAFVGGIDMTGATWNGCVITEFAGTLNGNHFALKDVTLESGVNSLFGELTGTISNLGIYGIEVTPSITTGSSAGLLAATANGATVSGTYVIGEIDTTSSQTPYTGTVGGLIGSATGSSINGVVVSGKLVSGGNVGGIIGSSVNSTVINCLSTAYCESTGANGVASGVVAAVSDEVSGTATNVSNAIYGGQSVADTVYNFGPNTAVTAASCFYDKQIVNGNDGTEKANTVMTHQTAASTLGLSSTFTSAHADSSNLYYPIPSSVYIALNAANQAAKAPYIAGFMLASASIRFMNGGSIGSPDAFTNIYTYPVNKFADPRTDVLTFTGTGAACMSGTDNAVVDNTSSLTFGQTVPAALTYASGDTNGWGSSLAYRYLKLLIGKVLKVTYEFTGLPSNSSAVFTLLTGLPGTAGRSSTSALAVPSKQVTVNGNNYTWSSTYSGTLCSSILPVINSNNEFDFVPIVELPIGNASTVTARIYNSGTALGNNISVTNGAITVDPTSYNNSNFDEIKFTIAVASDAKWGVHEIRKPVSGNANP